MIQSFGQILLATFEGTFPVLVLLLLGMLMTWPKILLPADFRKLSALVFRWTFPIATVYLLGRIEMTADEGKILGAFFGMIVIDFVICLCIAPLMDRNKRNFLAATVSMWCGTTLTNCVAVGQPIIESIFDAEDAKKYCYLHILPWGVCLIFYHFMYELWVALTAADNEEAAEAATSAIPMEPVTQPIGDGTSNAIALASERGMSTALTVEHALNPSSKTTQGFVNEQVSNASASDTKNSTRKSKIPYGKIICASAIKTMKVPLIIGVLVGLVYMGIATAVPKMRTPPKFILNFFTLIGSITTPVANVMMGLYTMFKIYEIRDEHHAARDNGELSAFNKHIWLEIMRFSVMTLLRQLITPVIMMFLMHAMKLDAKTIVINTITAATPTGILCFVLSDYYKYGGVNTWMAAVFQMVTMLIVVPTMYYICVAYAGEYE
ncbi:Membrane transport protein [Giardia muris]|uniref:Membrane transport protein n=1 Tax=Giardia muris TaxID=5742 RepID=A0A4Z1SVI0_GIAMU|nr:Membrane transport protein [Giardia muris]|eukprot:TNJ29784.1 Membrane transport protein [Giardia muris]